MSTVVEAPAVDRPQAGLAPPRDQRGYSPEVERYGGVSVIVIRDSAKLRAYLNEWEDLAACAVEPNIFYEPWMLLPAIDSFAAGAALEFVLAFAPDKANLHRPKVLCGLFPLERRPRYRGLPVTTLRLWKHDHCYLCAPLLRAGYAAEALSALFDWLDNESESPLLELNCVPGEGPFNHVLTDVLNRRASLTFQAESFTRAMFKPAADANAYLSCAISNRHRKALRRKQKRLSGEGRLEFALLDTGEDPSRWVEDFLESEAAGWKGRQKSALASSEAGRRFFTEIAMEGFRRRRLMMLELRLGGRAIAHKCNVLAGNGAFSFKIAFDEGYAQYSPGVLLELENIRRLHDRSGVEWMDSCAVSDHSMINRLWTGRRIIQTLLVAGASSPGGLLVSIMPLLR